MDLGIVLSSDYLPAHNLIKMAPLVDQLGYSQISVPEIWGHDAFSLISVLSQLTRKVELATGIVNIFSRTPATMAMTVASIDELSRGRFTLGLGLSGPAVIENLHGMKFEKPLTRTKEYVQVLRTLLNGRRLNHETSQLGHLKNFNLSIKNIRKDIPIHIAALGPKNIELTASIADGWIPVIMPIPAFKEEVEKIKSFIPADKSDFAITPFVLSILGEGEEELNLLRNHLAYYWGGMGSFYNNMLKRIGFEEEANTIMDLWNKGKIKDAVASVSDELLDLTCVFGDKDQMQEKMQDIINAGATRPLVTIPFKTNIEIATNTFHALAPVNMSN